MPEHKIPIRVSPNFFEEDLHALSTSVRHELVNFLQKLQENPYDPEILNRAESDKKGRWAYSFAPGYSVYWRVVSPSGALVSGPEKEVPTRVEVLAVSHHQNI